MKGSGIIQLGGRIIENHSYIRYAMTLSQKFNKIQADKFSFAKRSIFARDFARECGACSMFDDNFGLGIPPNLTPENQLRGVFVEIVRRDGLFLFNISGVDLLKAKKGFIDYEEAAINGQITEWELSVILANKDYLKKCIFYNGKVRFKKNNTMEINSAIVGAKLNEIQKKADEVKLFFEHSATHKIYVLTFEGLLFETSTPSLDRRVKNIELDDVLGFRVISQLRTLHKNPTNYRQLFIRMEGSTDDNKIELLGALKNYKLSQKRPKTDLQS